MNTLTANRILQKGDEFQDNGSWKPVPKEEFGMQVLFSKLKGKQLRRPTENAATPVAIEPKQADQDRRKPDAVRKEHDHGIASVSGQPANTVKHDVPSQGADKGAGRGSPSPTTISPDSDASRYGKGETVTAKAENEKPPAPTRSGAGEVLRDDEGRPLTKKDIERAGLPTVISPKAHTTIPVTPTPNIITIKYPGLGAMVRPPTWTGRNGTFGGYGLEMIRTNNVISLQPVGKRGVGNCQIEFPVSVIPEIIDWLSKQTK